MLYCSTPSCRFQLDGPPTSPAIASGCPLCGNRNFVSSKFVYREPEPVDLLPIPEVPSEPKEAPRKAWRKGWQ